MKRRLMMSCALMGTLAVMAADDYPYLTLMTTDGTEQSVAVDNLVITFADGQLLATDGTTSQTFELSDLSMMYFSATAATPVTTAISTTETSGDGPVEAYTVGGRLAGTFASMKEARASLPKGIYVVKNNNSNKTQKISIR